MRRPWIRDKTTAVCVGLVLAVAGFVVLYDAYDGRGDRPPRVFRPFLPF
jgi:hypothetical protein